MHMFNTQLTLCAISCRSGAHLSSYRSTISTSLFCRSIALSSRPLSTGSQSLSAQDSRWRDVTLRVDNGTLTLSRLSKPSSSYTLSLPPLDARMLEYSNGSVDERGESTTTLVLNFAGDLKLCVRPRDACHWPDVLAQFGPVCHSCSRNAHKLISLTRTAIS